MKNLGTVVKMIVAAVMMSAFFCSCNVSGGLSYDSYSDNRTYSSTVNSNDITSNPQSVDFKINIKKFEISAQTEGNRNEVSRGEALQINCMAEDGSEAIGQCDWYVGGIKVASGEDFSFCQHVPGIYNVSCIAVDDAVNPMYADSVQLEIKVR